MRRILFSFLLLPLFALNSSAQNAPASNPSTGFPVAPVEHGAQQISLGNSALALMGPWKFRLGDDLAWAQPRFDDAAWQNYTFDAQGWPESILPERNAFDPGWGGHGYRGAPNYGWYRIHVYLDRVPSSLSLLVPEVDGAYTVYWDGQKLGGYGDPSRRWAYLIPRTQVFSVPSSLGKVGDHVLAVRVWDKPLVFVNPHIGLRGAPLLADGTTAPRIKQLALRLEQLNLAVTALTEVLPCLLVALISLLLFFYNRKRLEYLWTGLTLLFLTFADGLVVLDGFSAIGWLTETPFFIANVLGASAFLFSLLALQWLLALEDRRGMRVANLIAGGLTFLLWAAFTINGEWLGSVRAHTFLFNAVEISLLPCLACLLWMAVAGIRKLGREAWLMLSPGAVLSVLTLWVFFANGRLPLQVLWVVTDILTILVPASVLAILIYRFVRQWREHQRIEGELQQAQAVQALLVPEQFPPSLYYRVEGTYLPASQVGGDFYQVLPLSDGGLIVVLGDVSGKGLRAAMVVSMAVGAVRAIAKETSEPAAILTRLNRELAGNLKGGFVTCLCARFDIDGTVTVANAGHLPPWVNGKEVAMPGALPLGMLADQVYESQSFQMNDGEGIMVMSDGVVEARSEKDGQLYGFARLATLLGANPSAQQVAEEAMKFGQEDDISVLSVTRLQAMKAVLA
ncbi:MAG: PP2C family protein-serine/threonine phosphatase [Acidobacteriaceae bacterium]